MSRTARTTNLTRVAVAALVAVTMTGCSSSADEQEPTTKESTSTAPEEKESATPDPLEEQAVALDTYVAQLQAQIPELQSAFDDMYSKIDIVGVQPDAVEFSYVYLEQLDAAATASGLDSMAETLQATCDSTMFPEMESAGITIDPKVIYTYYNADGSLIWTRTFSKS